MITRVEVNKLVNFHKAYTHFFENAKIAFISNDLDQMTIPVLINDEISSFSLQPFNTKEVVINWLIG